MPAREWTMAKTQFAILFGERFTKAHACAVNRRPHTEFLTVPRRALSAKRPARSRCRCSATRITSASTARTAASAAPPSPTPPATMAANSTPCWTRRTPRARYGRTRGIEISKNGNAPTVLPAQGRCKFLGEFGSNPRYGLLGRSRSQSGRSVSCNCEGGRVRTCRQRLELGSRGGGFGQGRAPGVV